MTGKDEVQLSLGALLFPLTVLVFPASRLSFWPCVLFTDGLHEGGLGERERERESRGSAWSPAEQPGRLGAPCLCRADGINSSFEQPLVHATDCDSWMEFGQNNSQTRPMFK